MLLEICMQARLSKLFLNVSDIGVYKVRNLKLWHMKSRKCEKKTIGLKYQYANNNLLLYVSSCQVFQIYKDTLSLVYVLHLQSETGRGKNVTIAYRW